MKARVLKKFRDKYTREIYKKDDEIDISEKRYKEIIEKDNLIELVKDKENDKEECSENNDDIKGPTKTIRKVSNRKKQVCDTAQI